MHPDNQRFLELVDRVKKICEEKGKDYGRDEAPFANVEAVEQFGIDSWLGAVLRISDKLRRLEAYARNGRLVNEGVEDTLLDIATYSLIALVLFEKKRRKIEQA